MAHRFRNIVEIWTWILNPDENGGMRDSRADVAIHMGGMESQVEGEEVPKMRNQPTEE